MDEELIEVLAGESDEGIIESDEAIAESENGSEDVEARGRPVRRRYYRQFSPIGGVQGMAVRGQDGRLRRVPFPTRLATASETNRGLASQEVARRAVEQRIQQLETRVRGQQKKDTTVLGLATLVLSGGLTAYGAFQAGKKGGSRLGNWAAENTTKSAALLSASQLVLSGAKLAMNGKYVRSGVGVAADLFSAAHLAAFTFGTLRKPRIPQSYKKRADAELALQGLMRGTLVLLEDSGEEYEVVSNAANTNVLRRLHQ